MSEKGEHLSMQYAPVTALLVEAVKELNEAVEKDNIVLKAENEQLKGKIVAMESRMIGIENMFLAISTTLTKEKLVAHNQAGLE